MDEDYWDYAMLSNKFKTLEDKLDRLENKLDVLLDILNQKNDPRVKNIIIRSYAKTGQTSKFIPDQS